MEYLPEIIFGLSAVAIIGAGLYKFTQETECRWDDLPGKVFKYVSDLAKAVLSFIPDLVAKRLKK